MQIPKMCWMPIWKSYTQTMAYKRNPEHLWQYAISKLTPRSSDGKMHAKQRWPEAITEHLWPYAYNICMEIRKITPRSSDGKILQHVFCGSSVMAPDIKHLHPSGCQAFVLDWTLQSGIKQHKLLARCRMEIYLGHSPNHARSVHLILSMHRGHASPQFYIVFDDMFETIREIATYRHLNGKLRLGWTWRKMPQYRIINQAY